MDTVAYNTHQGYAAAKYTAICFETCAGMRGQVSSCLRRSRRSQIAGSSLLAAFDGARIRITPEGYW